MHGGLFKDENITLAEIRKYDRNRQPPEEGISNFSIIVVYY